MAEGLTKADAAKMQSLAGDIRKCHSQMNSSVENGKAKVDSLKGVWTGAAANDFYTQFNSLYSRCDNVLNTVEKMANDLSAAAEVYSIAERNLDKTVSELKKLPTFEMK